METIVVERRFDQPESMERLQAAEDAVAWCLEEHRVRFLRSFFSRDRRNMICIYEAPDAEAVRVTQRKAGLPVERVWPALLVAATGRYSASAPRSTIIVQRSFPEPMTAERVEATLSTRGDCLELYRAELLVSHLSRDGRRMVCVFDAPDGDSVRMANRQIGIPVDAAWPASVHTPAD